MAQHHTSPRSFPWNGIGGACRTAATHFNACVPHLPSSNGGDWTQSVGPSAQPPSLAPPPPPCGVSNDDGARGKGHSTAPPPPPLTGQRQEKSEGGRQGEWPRLRRGGGTALCRGMGRDLQQDEAGGLGVLPQHRLQLLQPRDGRHRVRNRWAGGDGLLLIRLRHRLGPCNAPGPVGVAAWGWPRWYHTKRQLSGPSGGGGGLFQRGRGGVCRRDGVQWTGGMHWGSALGECTGGVHWGSDRAPRPCACPFGSGVWVYTPTPPHTHTHFSHRMCLNFGVTGMTDCEALPKR